MENEDHQFPPKFLVNLKDTYKMLWMGFTKRGEDLLVSPQELMVLVWSTSEGWKASATSHILINPLGISLSRNFCQYSFKTVYVTIVGVNLKIYFKKFILPENSFSTRIVYSCPQAKLSPMFISSPLPLPHLHTQI